MFFVFLFAVSVARAMVPLSTSLLPSDRAVMQALCAQTNIADLAPELANFANWCVPGTDPCDWAGVTCNSPTNTVIDEFLMMGNISDPKGVLPAEIAEFSGVRDFALRDVNLTGQFNPAFFAQQARLERFELFRSPISGQIPEVFNFALRNTLRTFLILDADFNGTIPGALGELESLRILSLQGNSFKGPLPPEIGNLPDIEIVAIRNTKINGSLPESWCFAPSLIVLSITSTQLSQLPDCLNLADPSLACDLRDNLFCQTEIDAIDLGPCQVEPVVNGKIDRCGVCGGIGKDCVDCAGVVQGTSEIDACGECGGSVSDAELCPDCAGTPGGSLVYDACGVCGGDGQSCADCSGAPFGSKYYDKCDVCGGDNSACTDCYGLLFGTATRDVCGICGGDGTKCLDCSGRPLGEAVYDKCDVCGGDDSSCADCSGVPNGSLAYDRCDVCGGDGSQCGLRILERQQEDATANETSSFFFIIGGLLLAACLLGSCLYCLLARGRDSQNSQNGGLPQRSVRNPATINAQMSVSLLPAKSSIGSGTKRAKKPSARRKQK